MKEVVSTLTSEGQVTIPVEVREYLGIKANDKIAFVIDDDGIVRLRVPRYRTIASLRGAAGSLLEHPIQQILLSTQSLVYLSQHQQA